MIRDKRNGIPIKVWPREPLRPLPRYRRVSWCRLNTDRDALFYAFEGPRSEYSVPDENLAASDGEIYLKLYALDLDDPDAIVGFVGQYSVLQGDKMDQLLNQEGFFLDQHSRKPYLAERRQAYERARREKAGSDDLPVATQVETLLDFRIAAYRLQRVTDHWRYLTGANPQRRPQKPWHSLVHLSDRRGITLDVLSLLLRKYSPTIEGLSRRRRYWPVSSWALPAPLFEVCALELFNHVAEGATYRTCANEPCSKPFVHQESGSEHGMSRTQGLKYCSPRCAQAAASRAYRRRRAIREQDRAPEETYDVT